MRNYHQREGEIAFTEDVLDEVSHRYGYDRKLVEKLYNHCANTLEKEVRSGDNLAVLLPNFGVIFLTFRGMHLYRRKYWLRLKEYLVKKYERCEDEECKRRRLKAIVGVWEKIEYYDELRDKAMGYTQRLKEMGQNRVAYLDRYFGDHKIINE